LAKALPPSSAANVGAVKVGGMAFIG
jgi:hypothetical protein